jgi:hypothetical protein
LPRTPSYHRQYEKSATSPRFIRGFPNDFAAAVCAAWLSQLRL